MPRPGRARSHRSPGRPPARPNTMASRNFMLLPKVAANCSSEDQPRACNPQKRLRARLWVKDPGSPPLEEVSSK